MVEAELIYGAKAAVYLKSGQDIELLASRLSKGLVMLPFDVAKREQYPHDKVCSNEMLGFEIWLEKSDLLAGYQYLFKIETKHSLTESFKGQIHDLSFWLARYVSEICDTGAAVVDGDKLHEFKFKNDECS